MNCLYVIVSNDQVTIDAQIKKLCPNSNGLERIFYDLLETPIERVIEDLDTYNFFTKKKVVIATNATFLSNEKKKGEIEHQLNSFEKYLKNPNPENILVLITDSLDKRKKIVTALLEKATVLDKELSLNVVLKDQLLDFKMEQQTLDYLITYCGNQKERVLKEIEKLKIYKWEEKEITIFDVQEIVFKNLENNIYSLVDSILNANKRDSFSKYQDLLLQGEQASSILSKLANKIRLIYQVKILLNEGFRDLEIAKQLNMHPYPIKLAREASYQYSEKLLMEYLLKLAQVDLEMKSGNPVANLSLEVFIASI